MGTGDGCSTNKTGIPVIDLSSASNDDGIDDSDAVQVAARQLVDAFRTVGFATVRNHGVPAKVVDCAAGASKSFFRLDDAVKLKYKYMGHESNRGYIRPGAETHEASYLLQPDKKETFDIGLEGEEGFETPWPSELMTTKETTTTTKETTAATQSSFKTDLLRYWDEMNKLFLRLLRLIALGLKLDNVDYFVERCNEQHCNLRLLHYPALSVTPPSAAGGADDESPLVVVRGARHTDFGVLTLLAQIDMVGGLRIQMPNDGEWINVPPVQHGIVVNVGDMLQRWTNDMLRATPHQVISRIIMPAAEEDAEEEGAAATATTGDESVVEIPERYSIAFFCNANKNVVIECLENVPESGAPAKYPPVRAMDYLTKRLADTIAHQQQ